MFVLVSEAHLDALPGISRLLLLQLQQTEKKIFEIFIYFFDFFCPGISCFLFKMKEFSRKLYEKVNCDYRKLAKRLLKVAILSKDLFPVIETHELVALD